MKPYFQEPTGKLYQGNTLAMLKEMPDESVDMIMKPLVSTGVCANGKCDKVCAGFQIDVHRPGYQIRQMHECGQQQDWWLRHSFGRYDYPALMPFFVCASTHIRGGQNLIDSANGYGHILQSILGHKTSALSGGAEWETNYYIVDIASLFVYSWGCLSPLCVLIAISHSIQNRKTAPALETNCAYNFYDKRTYRIEYKLNVRRCAVLRPDKSESNTVVNCVLCALGYYPSAKRTYRIVGICISHIDYIAYLTAVKDKRDCVKDYLDISRKRLEKITAVERELF